MTVRKIFMEPGDDLLTAYTNHQRARGLSLETVRRRSVSIGLFRRYIAPVVLADVDATLIEEWLSLFPVLTTRRAYRADLSAFYKWAVRRRVVAENPVDNTDPIRVPQGLPRPVDATLIHDLIRFAPDRETQIAVALGAYAGLRCAEIAAITRDDLSPHTNPPVLIVRNGKGSKDRVVPMHPGLVRVLEGCGAGRLTEHTKATIGRKVSEYLRGAGINATLHALRHTFGTEAARVSNGNVLVVRDLMGHASPTTTVRYTALAASQTAATVVEMFAPDAPPPAASCA